MEIKDGECQGAGSPGLWLAHEDTLLTHRLGQESAHGCFLLGWLPLVGSPGGRFPPECPHCLTNEIMLKSPVQSYRSMVTFDCSSW